MLSCFFSLWPFSFTLFPEVQYGAGYRFFDFSAEEIASEKPARRGRHDIVDALEYLGGDPETEVIVIHMEGLKQG